MNESSEKRRKLLKKEEIINNFEHVIDFENGILQVK